MRGLVYDWMEREEWNKMDQLGRFGRKQVSLLVWSTQEDIPEVFCAPSEYATTVTENEKDKKIYLLYRLDIDIVEAELLEPNGRFLGMMGWSRRKEIFFHSPKD